MLKSIDWGRRLVVWRGKCRKWIGRYVGWRKKLNSIRLLLGNWLILYTCSESIISMLILCMKRGVASLKEKYRFQDSPTLKIWDIINKLYPIFKHNDIFRFFNCLFEINCPKYKIIDLNIQLNMDKVTSQITIEFLNVGNPKNLIKVTTGRNFSSSSPKRSISIQNISSNILHILMFNFLHNPNIIYDILILPLIIS